MQVASQFWSLPTSMDSCQIGVDRCLGCQNEAMAPVAGHQGSQSIQGWPEGVAQNHKFLGRSAPGPTERQSLLKESSETRAHYFVNVYMCQELFLIAWCQSFVRSAALYPAACGLKTLEWVVYG